MTPKSVSEDLAHERQVDEPTRWVVNIPVDTVDEDEAVYLAGVIVGMVLLMPQVDAAGTTVTPWPRRRRVFCGRPVAAHKCLSPPGHLGLCEPSIPWDSGLSL